MKTAYEFGKELSVKLAANPPASAMSQTPQNRSWLQWFLGTGGTSNVQKAKQNPNSNISLRNKYLNQYSSPSSQTARVRQTSTAGTPSIRR